MYVIYDPITNEVMRYSKTLPCLGDRELSCGYQRLLIEDSVWQLKTREKTQLVWKDGRVVGFARRVQSAPVYLDTEIPDAPDSISTIAILAVGGLGDDLIKLNVTRQLVPILREKIPGAFITYFARQRHTIFDKVQFVDAWDYAPKGIGQSEISNACSKRFDLTIDMRFISQVIPKGGSWVGDPFQGIHSGVFIEENLAKSLGPFAFERDNGLLLNYITTDPSLFERRKLSFLLPKPPYVVIADGTDPSLPQGQTKRLSHTLIVGAAKELSERGFGVVITGPKEAQKIKDVEATSLVGQTTLVGLAYVLRHSAGVISAEGGVAHLATHLGLPVCVLFGPTDPTIWGHPQNLNISSPTNCPKLPCSFKHVGWNFQCANDLEQIGHPACMTSHNPSQVVEKFLVYLDAFSNSPNEDFSR